MKRGLEQNTHKHPATRTIKRDSSPKEHFYKARAKEEKAVYTHRADY